jgi:very-short-patch-repair endonuclease
MRRDLNQLARRQHGVLSRDQLREQLSDNAIDRRVRRGSLKKLHRGVFATPSSVDTFERRIVAAALAAGPGAAISHFAAAHHHRFGGTDLPRVVDVSVPSMRRRRLGVVDVHRVTWLPPEDTLVVGDLRVTSPARTICDLAGSLSRRNLELVLDDAILAGRVKLDVVASTLSRMPANTKGAHVLRALIEARPDGRARVESPLEWDVQAVLREAGLEFRTQYEVAGRRLDIAFPEEKLTVEPMGYRWHGSRTAWARDVARDRDLLAAGWRVFPVTKEDLKSPSALVAKIRQALAAARIGVGSNG